MGFFARRLFLVGAVLTAVAMLMTPALAGADDDDDDGGGSGGGDRAFCVPAGPPEPGQCSVGGTRFDFEASSGPLGESPTGTFRIEFLGGAFYQFEIACLQVAGNRASFGGTVTASTTPLVPVGSWAAFTVLDNAPLGSDRISSGTFLEAAPPAAAPGCGDGTPLSFGVTGDIVVEDNVGGGGDDDDDDDGGGDDDDDDGGGGGDDDDDDGGGGGDDDDD